MSDGAETPAARVYRHYDALSPAMRKVAQFVMRHPDRAATMSALEVAEETRTSDATVVRTAQALGFVSMKDMRTFALEMLKNRADPSRQLASRIDRVSQGAALTTVVSDTVANLQVLAELEVSPAWQAAVEAADRAEELWCYGVPPVGYLGAHLADLLVRIGRRAHSSTATGIGLADELLTVGKGTVVVVFAPVRVFREHAVVFDRARRQGATSILVTEAVDLPATDGADVVLPLPTASLDATGELLMPAAVAQALVLALARREPERAGAAMDELNAMRRELGKERRVQNIELPSIGPETV